MGLPVYLALHAGSSDMSTVGLVGVAPVKCTVPLTTPSPDGPVDAVAAGAPPAAGVASAGADLLSLLPHETVSARMHRNARFIIQSSLVRVGRPWCRRAARA